MKSRGRSMGFTRNPVSYLVVILFAAVICVSAIAPKDISLVPFGPSPNPYEVAR